MRFKNIRLFPFLFAIILWVSFPCLLLAQTAATPASYNKKLPDAKDIITRFFHDQAKVNYISHVVLHPKATSIAWSVEEPDGSQVMYRSSLPNAGKATRMSATQHNERCSETEPQWSPDGRQIAFLSDAKSKGQLQVFVMDATTLQLSQPQPLTHFDGYVSHLRWSPDGKYLSVLYVEKASREPSPMAAENRAVGLIDSIVNRDVQRLAVVNMLTGKTRIVSPADFYIFEYDWSADSRHFVYTGAPPPGDDNWYIAKLYRQSVLAADTVLLYQPLWQIALPQWSPDNKSIAFIEGLMSDQGGTGGEIFSIPAAGGQPPVNLTPDRKSTPAWFTWRPDGSILFTEFVGGSVAANALSTFDKSTRQLWKADKSIRSGSAEMSLSVAGTNSGPIVAFAASSWHQLPEIFCGGFNDVKQVSNLHSNLKWHMPKAENVEWMNEGQPVQGWLLYPADYSPSGQYPMLVCVHGGPAWITTPTCSAPDFNTTVYTRLGYFVFFPNPRGSYGQGEAFTLANRRDWGFADLRDITSGVDAVIKKLPIDSNKVGILGWSYGGFMSMFAITQTSKFRAAVAGAGAGDWLSYYGQNSIDKWMGSYFGASPYSDPAAYARCSAMTYIKNAKTPTLLLVGERDGEAPPPQSFQFWHALKELHVPTQLMVYPDEGHSFYRLEDMIDVSVRTIEWFNKYIAP